MDLFLGERIIPDTPKSMNLREIGVDFAMKYNEQWHSRLPVTNHSNMIRNTHKIFYGAEYQDHCFAVAMWTLYLLWFAEKCVNANVLILRRCNAVGFQLLLALFTHPIGGPGWR